MKRNIHRAKMVENSYLLAFFRGIIFDRKTDMSKTTIYLLTKGFIPEPV